MLSSSLESRIEMKFLIKFELRFKDNVKLWSKIGCISTVLGSDA